MVKKQKNKKQIHDVYHGCHPLNKIMIFVHLVQFGLTKGYIPGCVCGPFEGSRTWDMP